MTQLVHSSPQEDRQEDKKKRDMQKLPHFWNLNEDPQLTNMVAHLVKTGKNRIGNKKAKVPPEIMINGLSIQTEHAVMSNKENKEISLCPTDGAKILLNGEPLTGTVTLHHNDRSGHVRCQSGSCCVCLCDR